MNSDINLLKKRTMSIKKFKHAVRLFSASVLLLLLMYFVLFNAVKIKESFTLETYPVRTSSAVNSKSQNEPINVHKEKLSFIVNQLNEYLKTLKGNYGIYYYNLITGDSFGINDTAAFPAASTVKLPLNLYLYRKITDGTINPDSLLKYEKQDYEEGTGKIQYKQLNSQFSIKELSRLSIEESDNIAANILFRYLGKNNVKNFMSQCGASIVEYESNITCARDMGLYMKLLYNFCKYNATVGNELLSDLTNTQFNDRIPAGIPKSITVAHKIGTLSNVINDVGIIFTDKPYVLSVLSNNVTEKDAVSAIKTISEMVYNYNNTL